MMERSNDMTGKFTIDDIMQGIPGGFFIYRAGGDEELIYANDAMVRLFRCDTMEEFQTLTGNSFRGIVHPDDLERVEAHIANQIEDDLQALEDYVEYRIIRKDGTICWVEDFGHMVHDETEGDIFYVFVSDITQRIKKRDRERTIHQEMIDAASSRERQSMEMIQALTRDYTNVYWVNLTRDTVDALRMSSAITKNFGNRFQAGRYENLIRYYVETAVYEPDRELLLAFALPGRLMHTLERESSCAVNYRVMRDGEIEYFRMNVSRIDSAGEDVEVAIGFSNVDTEIRREMEQRKLVESALAQAQRANSAKTTFLSNMSHDMRTPMNAIMGFSAIAAGHIDDTERVRDCLEKISSSSAHLLSLINDILDMSRIESGKMQLQEKECNLSQLLHTLEDIVQPQIKAKQLDFHIDADVTDEDVYTDPLKVNQIFINILGNAVKFTPAGGAVLLRMRQKPCPVEGYGTYEFSVKDTGIGMSAGFIEHIFEPFERESTTIQSGVEGTGLGMAITKNIVDILGGSIQVSSEKGVGTEFVITLDLKLRESGLTDQRVEASTAQLSLADMDFRGKRVLLVEDIELNRELAAEILQEAGFEVEVAMDGAEAVAMVERSEEFYYDIILTDIQMPVMDGYEEVVAIRSMKRQDAAVMPIIAMTANAFEEDKALALKCGMNGHIAKPLDMSTVFMTLYEHLKEIPG